MDSFGKRLQKELDKKLWSQTDFIEKCNAYVDSHPEQNLEKLNKGILSQYLHDRCKPKNQRLYLMAKVLGITQEELTNDAKEETPTRIDCYRNILSSPQTKGVTLAKLTKLSQEHYEIVADLINQFYEEEQQENNR